MALKTCGGSAPSELARPEAVVGMRLFVISRCSAADSTSSRNRLHPEGTGVSKCIIPATGSMTAGSFNIIGPLGPTLPAIRTRAGHCRDTISRPDGNRSDFSGRFGQRSPLESTHNPFTFNEIGRFGRFGRSIFFVRKQRPELKADRTSRALIEDVKPEPPKTPKTSNCS